MDDTVWYTQITRACYFELIQDPGDCILQVNITSRSVITLTAVYTVGVSNQFVALCATISLQSSSGVITTDLSMTISTQVAGVSYWLE